MWETVGNGVTSYVCRTNEAECDAYYRRVTEERKATAAAATTADFFTQFGFSKDELTMEGQTQYRDAHRRYVHPPSGRTFKHPFGRPNFWTETTTN